MRDERLDLLRIQAGLERRCVGHGDSAHSKPEPRCNPQARDLGGV
jgi:hypothetical protein